MDPLLADIEDPSKPAKPKKRTKPKPKPKPKKRTKPKPKKKLVKKKAAAKHNGDARTERLDMRLTKAQKAKIDAKAKKTKRTVTSLVTEAIDKIR